MRHGQFPSTRLRRLRQNNIRDLIQEHHLRANDLVWPVFVLDGQNCRETIPTMPDIERLSLDLLLDEVKKAEDVGIKALAIFPVTPADKKSDDGSESLNADNLMCKTLQTIKQECPDLVLIADVALDPYTSHGHDGLVKEGEILNDETIEILSKQAVLQAQAGADIVAPSDMMDGRIQAIRSGLESQNLKNTLILSYAAKYASCFYGPFRDAVGSGTALQGDKKTYQMNPANSDEAMREIALDIEEGADMIMIKPGLPYLDIIRRAKENFMVPICAYQVSGEYAQLKFASEHGAIDYQHGLIESLLCFKRAGSNLIFTYGARDAAKLCKA